MDGTLLDLHFDNHFWLEHLPQRYAELHGVSRAMAELELQPLFERNAGQLQWYCLDFWSTELKLPVRELKLETAHLIALRPDADTFLAAIKRAGKRGADHQCASRFAVIEAGKNRAGAVFRTFDQLPRLRFPQGETRSSGMPCRPTSTSTRRAACLSTTHLPILRSAPGVRRGAFIGGERAG